MNEKIQKKLKNLPEAPGVYRMLDESGRIIYIGKSKCLKKRVNSYFVPNPKWEKAEKMVRFIHDLEYTVMDTHLEAQLLECKLIKEIQPYFNVQMKNDRKYFYLKIESDYRKNPLKQVYEKEDGVFGPFRSRHIIEDWILAMCNLYPLEKEKFTWKFQYHILPVQMSPEQFCSNRELLLELFRKKTSAKRFLKRLEASMKEAASQERYEYAMRYRDLAQGWEYISHVVHLYEDLQKTELVYCVPIEDGYKYFYIKNGLVVHMKKAPDKSREQAQKCRKEGLAAPETGLISSETISEKGLADYKMVVFRELSEPEMGAEIYEI